MPFCVCGTHCSVLLWYLFLKFLLMHDLGLHVTLLSVSQCLQKTLLCQNTCRGKLLSVNKMAGASGFLAFLCHVLSLPPQGPIEKMCRISFNHYLPVSGLRPSYWMVLVSVCYLYDGNMEIRFHWFWDAFFPFLYAKSNCIIPSVAPTWIGIFFDFLKDV